MTRAPRTTPRRRLAGLAVAAAVAATGLAVPADSHALVVGLGDQKAETFSEPLYRALKVKRTRLIVPWDAGNSSAARAEVDRWIRASRASGAREIMIAFNLSSDQACPAQPCKAPSVRSYKRAVTKFHKRFRRYVKIYQPWNESNSRTQPTSGTRGAKRVAQYYEVLRRMCGRRCLVTGADIQDIGAFTAYAKTFLRSVKKRPKVMGFHNYTDTNRFSTKNTAKYVKAMPRGTKVWLTETGGLYRFTTQEGVHSLPPDENRAARSMAHMFRIAKKFRRSIDRIYVYQWRAFETDRFDAGVVNPDGTKRRSYDVLRKNRKYIR